MINSVIASRILVDISYDIVLIASLLAAWCVVVAKGRLPPRGPGQTPIPVNVVVTAPKQLTADTAEWSTPVGPGRGADALSTQKTGGSCDRPLRSGDAARRFDDAEVASARIDTGDSGTGDVSDTPNTRRVGE